MKLKLDKTADNFIIAFDETGQKYRDNMKVLNWQQEQQKRRDVPIIENIGYKDFVSVQEAYRKEQERLKKVAAAAKRAERRERLRAQRATLPHPVIVDLQTEVTQGSAARKGSASSGSSLGFAVQFRERGADYRPFIETKPEIHMLDADMPKDSQLSTIE